MLFFSLQQCMGHLFSLHQYCTMVKSVFCIVLYNSMELASFLSLDNSERITLNELHQTEHLTYNMVHFPATGLHKDGKSSVLRIHTGLLTFKLQSVFYTRYFL